MNIKYSTLKQYGCEKPVRQKYTKQGVPCGKCLTCIKKKRGQWFLRLGHELHYSTSAYFVTLTYAEKCLPRVRGKPTLSKKDFNKFLKNVRKQQDNLTDKHNAEKQKIRYYGCGEYGDTFDRPHYHILLFNTLPDVITHLDKSWNYGAVHIGDITPARMMYTTKYMMKGSLYKDGRERAFVRMSTGRQKPSGIGGEWLKRNAEIIKENEMLTIRNINGDLQFLPRYYREYIWKDEDERKYVIQKHMKLFKESTQKENERLKKYYKNLEDWHWSTVSDLKRKKLKQLKK